MRSALWDPRNKFLIQSALINLKYNQDINTGGLIKEYIITEYSTSVEVVFIRVPSPTTVVASLPFT